VGELPRACFVAGKLAAHAEFFPIGTNDLTQTAIGFSRDAVEGRIAARPGLEIGVCGEHGGDPDSIRFFHRAGFDHVSCSPFRLPLARVAAAQAALAA